eukprot:scaffold64798_cov63-Phaeocystis_antarctica.AAC.1
MYDQDARRLGVRAPTRNLLTSGPAMPMGPARRFWGRRGPWGAQRYPRLQPQSGLATVIESVRTEAASVQSEATRDVQSEAVQSEDAPAPARATWLKRMVALEQQQAGPSSRLSYDGARTISSVDGGYTGTALAHG